MHYAVVFIFLLEISFFKFGQPRECHQCQDCLNVEKNSTCTTEDTFCSTFLTNDATVYRECGSCLAWRTFVETYGIEVVECDSCVTDLCNDFVGLSFWENSSMPWNIRPKKEVICYYGGNCNATFARQELCAESCVTFRLNLGDYSALIRGCGTCKMYEENEYLPGKFMDCYDCQENLCNDKSIGKEPATTSAVGAKRRTWTLFTVLLAAYNYR